MRRSAPAEPPGQRQRGRREVVQVEPGGRKAHGHAGPAVVLMVQPPDPGGQHGHAHHDPGRCDRDPGEQPQAAFGGQAVGQNQGQPLTVR